MKDKVYILTFVVLFILSIFIRWWIVFFEIPILLSFYKSEVNVQTVVVTITSLILIFMLSFSIENTNVYHESKIVEEYSNSYLVKEGANTYYLIAYDEYEKGDEISYYCEYTESDDYDFNKFLLSVGASGYCYAEESILVSESKSLTSLIHNSLINSGLDYYSDFVNIIILGDDSDLYTDIYELTKSIGIIHLFVISGFHIGIFILLIEKATSKSTSKKAKFLKVATTFTYVFMIGFPYAALRAWLYLVLKTYSSSLGFIENNDDIFFWSSVITISLKPYLLFNSGFWLSQLISFYIYLISKGDNNKYLKVIMISMTAFITSQSILLVFNDSIFLLSPILTIIFSPIIELVFIISLFTLPFVFLWPVVNVIFEWIYLLIQLTSTIPLYLYVDGITSYQSIILLLIEFISALSVGDFKRYLYSQTVAVSTLAIFMCI